jgi:hypothetical protein
MMKLREGKIQGTALRIQFRFYFHLFCKNGNIGRPLFLFLLFELFSLRGSLQFSTSSSGRPSPLLLSPYFLHIWFVSLLIIFFRWLLGHRWTPSLEDQGLILGLSSPQTGSFRHGRVFSTQFFGILDRGLLPRTDSLPAEPGIFNEICFSFFFNGAWGLLRRSYYT